MRIYPQITFPQVISAVLSALLIVAPISAQASADLQIQVVDKDNEAVAGSTSIKGFTVQVTDLTGAAVPDAAVVVRLPETGAGGTFSDTTRAAVVYTDQKGRAPVTGIHWGPEAGTSSIRITATRGTAHAGMLFEQVISASASGMAKANQPEPASEPVAPTPATPVVQTAPTPAPTPAPSAVQTAPAPAPIAQTTVPQPGSPVPRRVPTPEAGVEAVTPKVSVVNAPTHEKIRGSGGSMKWIIILAIAGAGAAGLGLAMGGKKSSSSTPASTGVSVGSPTVSIGNP